MKSFSRAEQVGKQIQRGVSDILQKGLQDPRLDMATVTGVKVSQDLRVAYVYYIIYGDENSRQKAAAGFKSASGFVKRSLAKRLKIKYMPDIRFCYDGSFDYGERIDQLLEQL
jgi:ribosome-binding factor A